MIFFTVVGILSCAVVLFFVVLMFLIKVVEGKDNY